MLYAPTNQRVGGSNPFKHTTSEQSSLCSVFLCRKTSARFLAPPFSQKGTLGSPSLPPFCECACGTNISMVRRFFCFNVSFKIILSDSFLTSTVLKQIFKLFSEFSLVFHIEMTVNVHCSADIGMPKPIRNIFHLPTLHYKHTGTAMAQIMKTYIF